MTPIFRINNQTQTFCIGHTVTVHYCVNNFTLDRFYLVHFSIELYVENGRLFQVWDTNLSIATFSIDTSTSTSFPPILSLKHLEIRWSMMQKVLGVLLIAAVSTKVNSSADSHGTQHSNVDSHGSQNSSHNVQSRGSRADNGCWQIKYYYRLDCFHVEFFIFNELWNVTDMTDKSV